MRAYPLIRGANALW